VGYVLRRLNGVIFPDCGTEVNRSDGWLVQTSDTASAGVPVAVQDICAVSILSSFNWRNSAAAPGSTIGLRGLLTARVSMAVASALGNSSVLYFSGSYPLA